MRSVSLAGFIIPILVGIFNILIILFPADIIAAARDGLSLWFNNVLPSLLPFIIFTNILSGCGALEVIGLMLEPVMRPLFGVPGIGGFALASGMVSGYPLGSKVVAQLRHDEQLTRIEAQRLLAFSNNSGPLFILGAVGVSMLNSAKLGYFIMAAHYISAIITGIIFKNYGAKLMPGKKYPSRSVDEPLEEISQREHKTGTMINRQALTPRPRKQPTIGKLLGDSVKNAVETIAIVGGFIILFSVIVRILEITQLMGLAQGFFGRYLHTGSQTSAGLAAGLIEITNGAKIISADDFSKTQIATICGVISFGGFCIHAQTLSFISHTDLKASVYILAKAVHGLIAFTTAALFFPLAVLSSESAVPAFMTHDSRFFAKLAFAVISFAALLLALMLVCVVCLFSRRVSLNRRFAKRRR